MTHFETSGMSTHRSCGFPHGRFLFYFVVDICFPNILGTTRRISELAEVLFRTCQPQVAKFGETFPLLQRGPVRALLHASDFIFTPLSPCSRKEFARNLHQVTWVVTTAYFVCFLLDSSHLFFFWTSPSLKLEVSHYRSRKIEKAARANKKLTG